MKRCALAVLLVGCASGGNAAQSDAPPGGVDAKVWADGQIEGNPDAAIDAAPHPDAPVDAAPHPDAPVDAAPHIDAAPMIDAPPDACVPITTELLANPAFDLAPVGTGWTEQNIDPAYPVITGDDGIVEQSAPYKAWMGGITGTDENTSSVTDQVYQDVAVPANTTQLVLTGYYEVRTSETGTTVYVTGSVDLLQTNGTPIEAIMALNNAAPTTAWTTLSHTFTHNVSGTTVRLRFTTTNDVTNATSFFFDTLSLKATHCP
jgi:hypothetical protein